MFHRVRFINVRIYYALVPMIFSYSLLFDHDDCLAVDATISYISKDGKAWVKKRSTLAWQEAHMDFKLDIGDSIKTGHETTAVILFERGSRKELTSNDKYQIKEIKQTENRIIKALGVAIKKWLFGKSEVQTHAGYRGQPGPFVIFPRAGKLMTPRTDWLLRPLPDTVAYEIRLERNFLGKCGEPDSALSLRFTITTADTIMLFSESNVELEAGCLYWLELRQAKDTDRLLDVTNCFALAAQDEIDSLNRDLVRIGKDFGSEHAKDPTVGIVSAAYLMEKQFYTAAYRKLKGMEGVYEDNPLIDSLLARLHELTKETEH